MPVEHDPDCCLHPESQCVKAGGCSSACNCGAGGGDECHPVTLPSGETISVLGRGEMSPEGVAALGELVEIVRAKLAAEHPADPGTEALWARVDARAYLPGLPVREAAKQAGVKPSVLSRLANGRMPDGEDLIAIEAWLNHRAADGCQCCVFGNHTEPCTCDGSNCCHPENHRGRSDG